MPHLVTSSPVPALSNINWSALAPFVNVAVCYTITKSSSKRRPLTCLPALCHWHSWLHKSSSIPRQWLLSRPPFVIAKGTSWSVHALRDDNRSDLAPVVSATFGYIIYNQTKPEALDHGPALSSLTCRMQTGPDCVYLLAWLCVCVCVRAWVWVLVLFCTLGTNYD